MEICGRRGCRTKYNVKFNQKYSVALSKISVALFLLIHSAYFCLIRPIVICSAFFCNARAPPNDLIFHISNCSEVTSVIKKNTYLVRVISSENEPRLEEISGKEWKQIVSANKNLPKEQKRYFMVSRIPVNGGYDRMYTPTSARVLRSTGRVILSSPRFLSGDLAFSCRQLQKIYRN